MKGEREVIEEVTSWCALKMAEHAPKSIFLPAGNTLVPVYRSWVQSAPGFLRELRLRQLDEVIEGEKQGCFADFFANELIGYTVEGLSGPEEPSDLAILGLGKNGHVAFHEPGLPDDFSYGEVNLSANSAKGLDVSIGTKAVTYGVGALLQAKALLLVVTGSEKRQIFHQFTHKEPGIPAVLLQAHPDFTVIVDFAARGEA